MYYTQVPEIHRQRSVFQLCFSADILTRVVIQHLHYLYSINRGTNTTEMAVSYNFCPKNLTS